MSEKTNPELNTEDVIDSMSEDAEKTVIADDDNRTIVADADEGTVIPENTDTEIDENAVPITDAPVETFEDVNEIRVENEDKKKPFFQIPVIIACCIFAAALIGFLAYMAFFLKEPENVTWAGTIDDTTYYYEFKTDGTFKGYLGSIEVTGSFMKSNGEDGKTITVDKTFGSFYQSAPATYSISGSRLFGNQEMTCSYSEDYQFTLTQSKREKVELDLPEEFTPDNELVGSWIFRYMNYDIYRVTFNDNGSMTLEFVQDGIKYNGIYTLEGSQVNFTFYVTESSVVPMDYSVDGDYLTFMGYNFVREGSEAEKAATADQQLITQATNDTADKAAETEAVEATEAAE